MPAILLSAGGNRCGPSPPIEFENKKNGQNTSGSLAMKAGFSSVPQYSSGKPDLARYHYLKLAPVLL